MRPPMVRLPPRVRFLAIFVDKKPLPPPLGEGGSRAGVGWAGVAGVKMGWVMGQGWAGMGGAGLGWLGLGWLGPGWEGSIGVDIATYINTDPPTPSVRG